MIFFWRHVVIACGLAAAIATAIMPGACAQEVLLDEGVERPFGTPEAIAALKEDLLRNLGPKGLAALPLNAEQVLPHISWWAYRVERNLDGTGNVRLVQRYDAVSTVTELQSWISGLKKDGCSFINPSTPEFMVGPKRITYSVGLSGKKRACGTIAGKEVSTDLGSISGSATGEISFRIAPSSAVFSFSGKIELASPTIDVDVSVDSILGINVSSVVGQLLTGIIDVAGSPFGLAMMPTLGVPAWAISSEIDNAMRDVRGRASEAAAYLDRLRGQVDPEQYNRTLANSQTVVWSFKPRWAMSDNDTQFVGNINNLSLEIVFTAPIPEFGQVDMTFEGADQTLRLLRSYRSATQTVAAQPGDSWTKLSKRYYGSAFLASALRASQPRANHSLRLLIGQSVSIPPLWKVGIIPNSYVVRPNDTYEGFCRRHEPVSVYICVKRLLELNPGIVPRQLPALSVIKVISEPLAHSRTDVSFIASLQ